MPKSKNKTILPIKKPSKKYKGVIFDFHFTMAHFYPSRERIYGEVLKKYGFTNSPKDIARAFSRAWLKYTDNELIEAFGQQIDIPSMEKWWLEFHSEVFMTLGIKDKKILESINKDISDLV
ncbi:MAG: hypothetical protein ABIF22_01620 [bacterium]